MKELTVTDDFLKQYESKIAAPCPQCKTKTVLTSGREVYPKKPHLYSLPFWICRSCWAYVACHENTFIPLGDVATASERRWRSKAHNALDPIWRNGIMERRESYAWLSEKLGKSSSETHIGMFGISDCKKVILYCKELLEEKSA